MCIGGYWAKPKQATNSPEDYRKMSQDIGFNSLVERDITANTLPTYDFLASLNEEMNIDSNDSYSKETSSIAWVSRLHLLRYLILSFQKPL